MDLPMNIYFWLLCIVPIVLLIVLLVGFQWSALKAAFVTLIVTIIIGMGFFRATFLVIGIELLRASWSSISIILVIISAIFLYEVSDEANAFNTLNHFFKTVAPNELVRILLIGVVFASFLQGVTGFGVPILVTAPLLIQIGLKPVWAVVIPLIGHSWAGTFGTLAIAWKALLEQIVATQNDFANHTAFFAGIFLFILTFAANFFIVYQYGKSKALMKGFIAIVVITVIQGGGQLYLSQINPELAAFLPSACALGALILLSKSPLYKEEWALQHSKIMREKSFKVGETKETETKTMSTFQALIPYLLMTILTLTVLLITPLYKFLNQFSYGPNLIETVTGYGVVNEAVERYSPITPFTHAGMFLFLAAFASYLYYKNKGFVKSPHAMKYIITRTIKRAISPSIAVLVLLAISRVMAGTGQTIILAEGITNMLGPYYILVAPFIGLLGSFITGSNMSSNILFGGFQYLTAEFIGANTSLIVGAQTAGGAIGMAFAPGNIILGTSATGTLGLEGKVMVKIIPFTLVVAIIFALLLFFIS